jgi:hypothetical protein
MLFEALETLAATVSVWMSVTVEAAVAVKANEDELPGILTDDGTLRSAELLVNEAVNPASGAAGEMFPTQDADSPGIRLVGVQVIDAMEYVTDDDDAMLRDTGLLAAPAEAVIVAV